MHDGRRPARRQSIMMQGLLIAQSIALVRDSGAATRRQFPSDWRISRTQLFCMSMNKEFQQIEWDDQLADDCRHIVRLAIREDLDRQFDWTTLALADEEARAKAAVVTREAGVIAGIRAAQLAIQETGVDLQWTEVLADGAAVQAQDTIAEISGSARDLLTLERTLLNLLGRLSGIATLTNRFVTAIRGTGARIYDTRKTTPGWRRLEKYAVRCGGGTNHRTGLFDAILIKDNHLALASAGAVDATAAVRQARQFVAEMLDSEHAAQQIIVEVEVDTLQQLRDVLAAGPDIVLLDNMSPQTLKEAVAIRDASCPKVELEASGGVHLDTVRAIAESGVERISVGSLTHSAVSLDIGLDWR